MRRMVRVGRLKTSTIVVWTAAATITFLVIATILWPYVTAVLQSILGVVPETGKEKEKYIYSGNLRVNLMIYNVYDDSPLNPDDDVIIKILHADGKTLFGTASGLGSQNYITGQVLESDRGILYLVVDHETGTTEYFLDEKTAAVNPYLTALSPRDVDNDGILEHIWKLDVSSLTPLQGGETYKEITLNLYAMVCDVTGLSFASTINPSSPDLSGPSYVSLVAEGYLTGVDEGAGFKVVRVELTMPNAGNESYVDTGKVKNVWVQINEDRWTQLRWEPAQDRFLVWEAADMTQEVYGKPYFYAKGAGATWFTYKVHIQGANFAPGAKWTPTLKITYINPAGTLGTVSVTLSFTDT